jgi:hypothetical protein
MLRRCGAEAPQRREVFVVKKNLRQYCLDVGAVAYQSGMRQTAAQLRFGCALNWRWPTAMSSAHEHITFAASEIPGHPRLVEVHKQGPLALWYLALHVRHPLPARMGLRRGCWHYWTATTNRLYAHSLKPKLAPKLKPNVCSNCWYDG